MISVSTGPPSIYRPVRSGGRLGCRPGGTAGTGRIGTILVGIDSGNRDLIGIDFDSSIPADHLELKNNRKVYKFKKNYGIRCISRVGVLEFVHTSHSSNCFYHFIIQSSHPRFTPLHHYRNFFIETLTKLKIRCSIFDIKLSATMKLASWYVFSDNEVKDTVSELH